MAAVEENPKATPEQKEEAINQALTRLTSSQKLELFIQLCQQGKSTAAALKASGIVPQETAAEFALKEVDTEELFYERCRTKVKSSDPDRPYASYGIIPDDKYDPDTAQLGDLTTSQLFKLVDWLYFVRGLPLKAIAASLQIPVKEVALIKGELSSEFSKAIRQQSAESWIGDLLRQKELLRADLLQRREKMAHNPQALIQLNKLLWELENKFLDRLQEIGIVDKALGKIDVHEEWHVTIGPAGQPINTKQELVSQQAFEDVEFSTIADRQPDDSGANSTHCDELNPEHLLAAATKQNAVIKVGDQ